MESEVGEAAPTQKKVKRDINALMKGKSDWKSADGEVIIKNINSIQNVGAIDILCTDKTGTLTQDRVILEYHLNIHGQEDVRVLRHAFLNSYYQTGLKNLMDIAIINRTKEEQDKEDQLRGLTDKYTKVDEIPFDLERRRMSVVVANGKTQVITKGAIEEMLSVCKYAEYEGKAKPLTDEIKAYVLKKVADLNEDGMRVLAIAHKNDPSPVGAFSVADESDMTLIGYLAFLDPPKESTAAAIKALKEHGVGMKVLTGEYFIWLVSMIFLYMLLATCLKKAYVRHYGDFCSSALTPPGSTASILNGCFLKSCSETEVSEQH
jgi:magnesium-transporting ATPase (P-type)